jgi:DNA-binding Lrp family transcriptional regulator
LQRDGRLTVTELAVRVRLSLSPCHRRVRALEQSGAITGYRAMLDAGVLGFGFEAIVFVTMAVGTRDRLAEFDQALAGVPNVLRAQRLFGEPDYLLQVIAKDASAFQQLYDEHLAALPGVQKLTSTMVMKEVVSDRPLPL